MGFQLSRDEGTRPDYGHIALQDVEELGELIEGCAAQDAANGCDARIVEKLLVALPFGATLGVFQQFLKNLVSVPHHGAQLPQLELVSPLPYARLLVEDGVRVALKKVRYLDEGGHWQDSESAEEADGDIAKALRG